jgi:hypothetical protein
MRIAGAQRDDNVEVARQPWLAVDDGCYGAGHHVRQTGGVEGQDEEAEKLRPVHGGRSPELRQ